MVLSSVSTEAADMSALFFLGGGAQCFIFFFFSSSYCRSIWSFQYLWTNIRPATRTPGAPPARLERTLFSRMMPEWRSHACPSSLLTPMGQPSRNADTSCSFRPTLTLSPLPASRGWTPPHIPRDEAKKKRNNYFINFFFFLNPLVLCVEGPRRHLVELALIT